MEFIFKKLLGVFGWQRLVLMAWNTAYPSMLKAAAKSETEFDDNLLKFVNELLVSITGKPEDVSKPEALKLDSDKV